MTTTAEESGRHSSESDAGEQIIKHSTSKATTLCNSSDDTTPETKAEDKRSIGGTSEGNNGDDNRGAEGAGRNKNTKMRKKKSPKKEPSGRIIISTLDWSAKVRNHRIITHCNFYPSPAY